MTFAWGVFELQRDAITYGVLLAFIQLGRSKFKARFRSLSSYVPTFINAATACERLMELEQMPADRAAMKRAFASPQSTTETGEKKTRRISPTGLRFSHVTYRYTPTSRIVLRDFSFYFAPGTVTAILGETGVGKTTLVRPLVVAGASGRWLHGLCA